MQMVLYDHQDKMQETAPPISSRTLKPPYSPTQAAGDLQNLGKGSGANSTKRLLT